MVMSGYKQLIMSDNNFKEYLNSFILRTGLSQSQFAKSVGLPPQQLNKYATGQFQPSQRTIQKIRSRYKEFMPVAIKGDDRLQINEADQISLALTKLVQKIWSLDSVKEEVKENYKNLTEGIIEIRKDLVSFEKNQIEFNNRLKALEGKGQLKARQHDRGNQT